MHVLNYICSENLCLFFKNIQGRDHNILHENLYQDFGATKRSRQFLTEHKMFNSGYRYFYMLKIKKFRQK